MEAEFGYFKDKNVNVEVDSGFHIFAKIIGITSTGIMLESKREKSYISFSNIKAIKLDRRVVRNGGG